MEKITVTAFLSIDDQDVQIEKTIQYLISNDINIYLIVCGSSEFVQDIAKKYLGKGISGIDSLSINLKQPPSQQIEDTLKHKEILSQQIDSDWFIHTSANEFRDGPWTGVNLRESIQRVNDFGFNAINFEVLNFQTQAFDIIHPYNIQQEPIIYYPQSWIKAPHVQAWKKTDHSIGLANSNGHFVEWDDRKIFPLRFILRRYSQNSPQHMSSKHIEPSHFHDLDSWRELHINHYLINLHRTESIHLDLSRFDFDEFLFYKEYPQFQDLQIKNIYQDFLRRLLNPQIQFEKKYSKHEIQLLQIFYQLIESVASLSNDTSLAQELELIKGSIYE